MIHLGLTPAQFGRMTPRQIRAMWDAWKLRERAHDRRAALMPWLYAEAHRDRKRRAEPWRIEDFMPGEPKPAGPVAEVDSRQVFALGSSLFGVKSKELTAEETAAIYVPEDFSAKAAKLAAMRPAIDPQKAAQLEAMKARYTKPNGQQPGR